MNRGILYRAAMTAVGVGLFAGVAAGADYSGKYEGGGLSVVIAPDAPAYRGEIRMGDQAWPMTAREEGNHLAGIFTADGKPFTFIAAQKEDGLELLSGGHTYNLHRNPTANGAPGNLPNASQPAPANPPAVAQPVASAPPGAPAPLVQSDAALEKFTMVNESGAGCALAREIPEAKTTLAALQATFPDLARYFGVRPSITGSYEDGRTHNFTIVGFRVKFNGEMYRGIVTARIRNEGGALVYLVFGRENATPKQWTRLVGHPKEDDGAGELQEQMELVPLRVYTFPDNTCSIGLAEGWQTNSQTEARSLLQGPAGQRVILASPGQFYTPNNQMVLRNGQMGGPLQMQVAPYPKDAADALAYIVRRNSAISQKNGGPSYTLNRVLKANQYQTKKPNTTGAQIVYEVTETARGVSRPLRVHMQFEVTPQQGSWMYYIYFQLVAPPETFQQDLPVMMAQAFSLHENVEAIQAKSGREMEIARQQFEARMAANKKIAEANYAHNRQYWEDDKRKKQQWADYEKDQTKRLRIATDGDEYIRGIRDIEDTRTGQKWSVDLADAPGIVDHLNDIDPGRYVQRPLRDEMYPLPAGQTERDYLPPR